MILSSIVATGLNGQIGKDNALLWSLKDDMQNFIHYTLGKTVIMGRRTYESIGKPLKNRKNIIITRNSEYEVQGAFVVHSFEDALEKAKEVESEESFIIGGETIYSRSLQIVQKLYLSVVNYDKEADVYFPAIDYSNWKEISKKEYKQSEKNEYDFTFSILERV